MSESDINSKLDSIKSAVGNISGSISSTVLIMLLAASGIIGYEVKQGSEPDVKDQWSVVDRKAGTVKEVVSRHYSGETFDFRVTELNRVWDTHANQVYTTETREGIHYVLPHYAYTESSRAITDADKASVARAVQALQPAQK